MPDDESPKETELNVSEVVVEAPKDTNVLINEMGVLLAKFDERLTALDDRVVQLETVVSNVNLKMLLSAVEEYQEEDEKPEHSSWLYRKMNKHD